MSKNKNQKKVNQISPMDIHQDATATTPSQQPSEAETIQVGIRIRAIRKQRGLTIRALAEQCHISPNTLSLIENEHTSPSIRTLGQLALGLGVNLSTLLGPEPPGQGVVYQQQGQRTVTRFANGTIENLGDGLPPLGAEPILVTLETHQTTPENVSHAGREFVYCLEGSVVCIIAGTKYKLSVGDSLLFDASIPHRWENTHSQPSRLLVLFCHMDAHDQPVEQHLGQ
ncbi:MAG: cupin domain-containing protein [Anaerolineales bacterium]|nr:cupin domain-containing protein [Anaerolineales bacterium]